MTESQENLHFLDYWRVIRSRKEVVIAVFLLVVVTGIMVTYAMPKVYQSSVVIAVKEEKPDVPIFSPDVARFDPLFLRTQFEVIQSVPVIEEAVRRRHLDEKLSKAYGYDVLPPEKRFEQTLKIFAGAMRVQQYRETNLIQIQIHLAEPKDTAPQEAADAAQAVAEVYRTQSMSRSREATERALKALRESLDEQDKKVVELESKLEDIREIFQIDMISSYNRSDSLDKMNLAQLDSQQVRVRLELEEKKARYETVHNLDPESLREAAPYVSNDPALVALVAEKRKAEVELSRSRKASLGPNHPDVVRVEAMIAELDQKINEALRGLKMGMAADYEAVKAKFNALEMILETRKAKERSAEGGGLRKFEKAKEDLDHAKRIRDALEMRYIQETIEMRIPRTTVEIIEPARAPDPDDPISPKLTLNLLLSVLLGLGAGVGLAYFIEYLDTSLKTVEDIERYMDVSVLGVIPQKVKPFVDASADPGQAEAYRVLRANIQFSKKLKGGKTLCVTSGSVGEGKSMTIFNLGFVCAQLGDRTLIVDSDLHRPRQHKILGVSNAVGLANILVGETSVEAAITRTKVPNLDFLPSGRLSTGVHGLLDTRRMKDLSRELKERYDIVLFDAPPMIGVSDASLLVREVEGVLLVIQHRKYPRTVSKRAKDMVDNLGANLLGVVLNNINISRDYSYYYHHYYSYSYSKPGTGQEPRKDKDKGV